MARCVLTGIFLVVVLLGFTAVASATDITGCTVIDTPGTYELVKDIIDSTEAVCLKITASDVTIEGKNHVVDGVTRSGSTSGVEIGGDVALSRVTIRNLKLSDWYNGIGATNLAGGTISGNEIVRTTEAIWLRSCTDTMVEGNTVRESSWGFQTVQFYLEPAPSGNTITGNTLEGNTFGIFVGGHDNTVARNTIRDSTSSGIWVMARENNVEGNTIDGGEDGIVIFGGKRHQIIGNTIKNSKSSGIWLSDTADDNTVRDNLISGSGWTSIFILNCTGNVFSNNFLFSTTNFQMANDLPNTWNIGKTRGTNIIQGPYLGGNYWGRPDGTGFSQTCTDADPVDGICDTELPLAGGNTDELPLTNLSGKTGMVTPDADTSVNAGAGEQQLYGKRVPVRDLNFGSSSGIVVQRGQRCMPGFSFWEAALVRFGLSHIAPGVGIRKATLKLTESTVNPEQVGVHRMLLPWTEREATFNRPCTACTLWSRGWVGGVNFAASPTATVYVTGEVGRSYSWDVTADVQAFVDGLPNNGWILRSAEVNGQSDYSRTAFFSRESSPGGVYNGPVLEIAFGDGGGGIG